MAHVGVNVDDETKEAWKNHIESSDYGSMSELVRTAVRKEMHRDGDAGGVSRELERRLTQVSEIQETLQRDMGGLLEGFEEVAQTATEDRYPDEIVALGHQIADGLEEVHADQFAEAEEQARDELRALAKEHLGDPTRTGEVREALQYLEDNLSYVESVPQPPSEYYRVRGR